MWMSIRDAAELLGCGERTLWRQVSAGEHKSRKAGRRREVWIASASPESPEPAPAVSSFEPRLPELLRSNELAELRSLVERQAAELSELRRRVDKLERSDDERQEPRASAPLRFPFPAPRQALPGRSDYDALLARFDSAA